MADFFDVLLATIDRREGRCVTSKAVKERAYVGGTLWKDHVIIDACYETSGVNKFHALINSWFIGTRQILKSN